MMTEDQRELIEEARDSVEAAEILLQNLISRLRGLTRLLRHVLSCPGIFRRRGIGL